MRGAELRESVTCALCGQLIGLTGLPLFWRVRIERHGIDLAAVQRQTGLALLLGNSALALAMGPDEEMTTPLMEPVMLTVCESCGTRDTSIAYLALEVHDGTPTQA